MDSTKKFLWKTFCLISIMSDYDFDTFKLFLLTKHKTAIRGGCMHENFEKPLCLNIIKYYETLLCLFLN